MTLIVPLNGGNKASRQSSRSGNRSFLTYFRFLASQASVCAICEAVHLIKNYEFRELNKLASAFNYAKLHELRLGQGEAVHLIKNYEFRELN